MSGFFRSSSELDLEDAVDSFLPLMFSLNEDRDGVPDGMEESVD